MDKNKALFTALFALIGYLLFEVVSLKAELKQAQRNTAIAVLSAEAANNKVGAIAPYFKRDDSAFAKAWMDTANMPLAVFPDEVLASVREEIRRGRETPGMEQLKAQTFGKAP